MTTGVIVLLIIIYLALCVICTVALEAIDFASSLFVGRFHNHSSTLRGIVKFLISPFVTIYLVVAGTMVSLWEKLRALK